MAETGVAMIDDEPDPFRDLLIWPFGVVWALAFVEVAYRLLGHP